MEIYRDKYENIKGKTDSLYIYVLYECTQDEIKNHIKKQLESIKRVADSYKRKTYSSRYFVLREFIEQNAEQNDENHIYNCVLFISDKVDEHLLTDDNKRILNQYNHKNISYKYGDKFDLEYLDDLIFNDNPYHMFRVNNNKIDYLCLTKTKKVIIDSKDSKSLDIMEFVNMVLPTDAKYIIYGISSKLKEIKDDRAYVVINGLIKDDDLIEMIERINQEDILIELAKDLLMISDIKQMQKITFKKEITSKIKNSQLQKIYIDVKLVDKFLSNIKLNGYEVNFKINVIDTSIKSFVNDMERILDQYDGVVGVTYY